MNEAQLQGAVIEMAHRLGWLVAHFRPAETKKGWRTPVAADGKGFPDLVMVKVPYLIFAELKGDGGKLSPEQDVWLGKLWHTPAIVRVWTPKEWLNGEIENVLRRPAVYSPSVRGQVPDIT